MNTDLYNKRQMEEPLRKSSSRCRKLPAPVIAAPFKLPPSLPPTNKVTHPSVPVPVKNGVLFNKKFYMSSEKLLPSRLKVNHGELLGSIYNQAYMPGEEYRKNLGATDHVKGYKVTQSQQMRESQMIQYRRMFMGNSPSWSKAGTSMVVHCGRYTPANGTSKVPRISCGKDITEWTEEQHILHKRRMFLLLAKKNRNSSRVAPSPVGPRLFVLDTNILTSTPPGQPRPVTASKPRSRPTTSQSKRIEIKDNTEADINSINSPEIQPGISIIEHVGAGNSIEGDEQAEISKTQESDYKPIEVIEENGSPPLRSILSRRNSMNDSKGLLFLQALTHDRINNRRGSLVKFNRHKRDQDVIEQQELEPKAEHGGSEASSPSEHSYIESESDNANEDKPGSAEPEVLEKGKQSDLNPVPSVYLSFGPHTPDIMNRHKLRESASKNRKSGLLGQNGETEICSEGVTGTRKFHLPDDKMSADHVQQRCLEWVRSLPTRFSSVHVILGSSHTPPT